MSKLQKHIFDRTLKSGRKQKIISIERIDGKRLITENDVAKATKELHTKLQKQYGHSDFKIICVTFDIDRIHSFNVNDEGDLMGYDDDYYHGRVKDSSKFEKTGRLDLIVENFS